MGRRKNLNKPRRLPLTLIEASHKQLEKLVETGGYGNSSTDAARIIIMRHLQELDAQKKIRLFEGDENISGDKR
jgi:hypothetical protein